MIFNIPLGGSSYITVTAPSTSSVSATCSGMTVSGVGSCTLEVPIIGEWTVSCTYDNTTLTDTVNVTTFGETYTKIFTFTATISITCPVGASIIASLTGQNDVTRTGPGDITVIKTGIWSVKCTYDGTELANTVIVASYGESYSTSFTYNATITISCPSGASIVASMSGQNDVTRTGPGDITVPKKGTWSVSCTYDGSTQTNNVTVAYGGSESVSFTYSCGIVIYTVGGTAVTLSQSGQTSQTKNASNGNAPYLGGSASFTVPKKGSWNVSAVYTAASDMITTQSTSVTAAYNDTKSYACNPRYYIYRYGNVDSSYYQTTQIGTCGITTNDSDGHGANFDPTYSHGYWRVYKFENTDGGMATMFTTQGICLRGFSRVGLTILRASNAWHLNFGLVNTNDKGTSTSTWRARTQLSGANSFDLSSEATYYVNFSTNETLRPVIYLLGGYITFRFWFVE